MSNPSQNYYQPPGTNPIGQGLRPIGKPRNPWIGLLLSLITFGIYGIVWGYCVFDEIKKYRGQGWSGAQYLIFSLIPILNIVGIATIWLLPAYVGRMYAEDGKQKPITGLTGFWVFLPILGGFIWWFRVNNRLNDFWVSKGAQPA